jgi:hypothetical protein
MEGAGTCMLCYTIIRVSRASSAPIGFVGVVLEPQRAIAAMIPIWEDGQISSIFTLASSSRDAGRWHKIQMQAPVPVAHQGKYDLDATLTT